VHELTTLQATLWLGRKALLGAAPGALLGAVAMAAMAMIVSPTGSSGSSKILAVLVQLGALVGAFLGGTAKAMRSWNRRQE
jgi:hypothetical protein